MIRGASREGEPGGGATDDAVVVAAATVVGATVAVVAGGFVVGAAVVAGAVVGGTVVAGTVVGGTVSPGWQSGVIVLLTSVSSPARTTMVFERSSTRASRRVTVVPALTSIEVISPLTLRTAVPSPVASVGNAHYI